MRLLKCNEPPIYSHVQHVGNFVRVLRIFSFNFSTQIYSRILLIFSLNCETYIRKPRFEWRNKQHTSESGFLNYTKMVMFLFNFVFNNTAQQDLFDISCFGAGKNNICDNFQIRLYGRYCTVHLNVHHHLINRPIKVFDKWKLKFLQ